MTACPRLRATAPPIPPEPLQAQWPGLRRYLRVLGAAEQELEDLLQDCALVYLRGGAVGVPAEELPAWLRGTLRRLLLGQRRGAQRRLQAWAERVEVWWVEQGESMAGEDCARMRAMQACLAQLDGRSAEVLRRVYGAGEDRAEVAQALGLRPLGLKTLLQRSRALLRACVQRRL